MGSALASELGAGLAASELGGVASGVGGMLPATEALAELQGPAAGLAAIEPLAERLEAYHLFHAARGELLRRLGRAEEAANANRRALALTDNPAERRLLEQRLASAAGG